MLAHAGLPLSYWYDAFSSATYLINRLPSVPLGNVSSYEKLLMLNQIIYPLEFFNTCVFQISGPIILTKFKFQSISCLKKVIDVEIPQVESLSLGISHFMKMNFHSSLSKVMLNKLLWHLLLMSAPN